MASNLTIESPNFEKIGKESGQFTADAVALLWAALNDTRAALRRDFRQTKEKLEPKFLTLSPSASVDNLDLQGASIVSFIGGTQNVTGFRAPDTGQSRLLWVHNSGSGTITGKNNATSETANRLHMSTGADYAMTVGKGMLFAYLASAWRELARTT